MPILVIMVSDIEDIMDIPTRGKPKLRQNQHPGIMEDIMDIPTADMATTRGKPRLSQNQDVLMATMATMARGKLKLSQNQDIPMRTAVTMATRGKPKPVIED